MHTTTANKRPHYFEWTARVHDRQITERFIWPQVGSQVYTRTTHLALTKRAVIFRQCDRTTLLRVYFFFNIRANTRAYYCVCFVIVFNALFWICTYSVFEEFRCYGKLSEICTLHYNTIGVRFVSSFVNYRYYRMIVRIKWKVNRFYN